MCVFMHRCMKCVLRHFTQSHVVNALILISLLYVCALLLQFTVDELSQLVQQSLSTLEDCVFLEMDSNKMNMYLYMCLVYCPEHQTQHFCSSHKFVLTTGSKDS